MENLNQPEIKYETGSANIIFSDFPDPDVIRVEDTYYMVSTTMHYMPGCEILRSYNLLDWEFCTYVCPHLDETPAQKLNDNQGIYGKGMWAASLRYHNELFFITFVCNDTHKSYLYTSEKIEGPWKKSEITGFYHDMSILFDDDGRTFIASGNMKITLTEMEKDLSSPKKNGINKVIIQDNPENVWLGYEGSHFYKINGKYYIFSIHIPKGKMRTQACFISDNVDGPYTGGDVLCADLGGWNSGCAQGGIVQAVDGKWYSILFQDHGALGRIPVLIPITFDKKGFPVYPNPLPASLTLATTRPSHAYLPLFSNNFTAPAFQWNHQPNPALYQLSPGKFTVKTDKIVTNITQASNTLTQRTFTEHCQSTVHLDATNLNNGDFSGLCALEGVYAFIAVTRENNQLYLVTAERAEKDPKMNTFDTEPPAITNKIPINSPQIDLRLTFSLGKEGQFVELKYKNEENFCILGKPAKLKYTLDQFVGVRTALFIYSTKETGGSATFTDFHFELI